MKNSLVKSENSGRTLADFQSFENGSVDCFEENSNLWFRLSDIGEVLELADSSVRKMKHDKWFDDDEINTVANRNGGARITYVSESALYRILNRSNSPKAKPFERWVTKVAIPSIRKTGSYQVIPPKVDERAIALEEDKQKVAKANIFLVLSEKYRDNKDYSQILDAYATKAVEGAFVLPLPERGEADYSATEAGKELRISSKTVGKIANKLEIKVDGENGKWYLDKSPYSNKEVQTFRYSRKGIEKIKEFLEAEKKA